jgi:hypothetical protein
MGDISAVQGFQYCCVNLAVAHFVEQVDERTVGLSVDVFEFNDHGLGLPEGLAAEKVGGVVVCPQQCPFFFFGYRCELVEVAYHEQLHATERLGIVAVSPQYIVYAVEQVSPNHTDFVNDQQVEASDEADFIAGKTALPCGVAAVARQVRPEWQLEQRVNGHATGIDGGYACGGHYSHPFDALSPYTLQKGGFSCASLARQENMCVRVVHVLKGQIELGILKKLHSVFFLQK